MRKKIVYAVMAAFLLLAAGWTCSPTGSQVPGPAPDISLPDLKGRTVRLADFTGRVVLLNFFATWCGPCRREIPDFIELQKKHGPAGLTIVGISLDWSGVHNVRRFCQARGINYPVLMAGDRSREIKAKVGGFRGIPTTFIIDRKSMIVGKVTGAPDKRFWENKIKKLL